jgi:hypothetical protein
MSESTDPSANGTEPEPSEEQIQAAIESMFQNPKPRPVRYGLTRRDAGVWQLQMQTPETSCRFLMTRDEVLDFAESLRAGVKESPGLTVAPPGMRIRRND